MSLAKYTLVNDGQTRWYADTQELVAGLVAAGYTYERYQGYDAVAEPEPSEDDREIDPGAAYSILCSLVSAAREVRYRDASHADPACDWITDHPTREAAEAAIRAEWETLDGRMTTIAAEYGDDIEEVYVDPSPDECETLDYEPGTVGEGRLRVSRDLGEAVYAATPEVAS